MRQKDLQKLQQQHQQQARRLEQKHAQQYQKVQQKPQPEPQQEQRGNRVNRPVFRQRREAQVIPPRQP
jgi:hypothetical protein